MFINLTPHVVRFQSVDDGLMELPSSGVARVTTIPGQYVGVFDNAHVYAATTYGEVENLPLPDERNITYIVSLLVLERCAGRRDVVAPGTGPLDGAVRFTDGPQKGQINYVTRFIAAPALRA